MNVKKLTSAVFACATIFASSAWANSFDNLSCSTNINSELTFTNNELTVKSTSDQDILFMANGNVVIDGSKLALTSAQKKLTKQYYSEIKASIPMIVNITVDALKITNMALNEVFDGLLGENNRTSKLVTVKLSTLSKAITDHVYQNKDSLTFNSVALKSDLGLGDNLEKEIENITSELLSNAMGELLMIMGKAMMSGGSNFSDLESRMNGISSKIESKADAIAAELEDDANKLCEKMLILDETETKLNKIDGLTDLDLISATKNKN